MPIGILFWVLMVIALLFGGYLGYGSGPYLLGHNLLLWVLLALLGWQVFGSIIK